MKRQNVFQFSVYTLIHPDRIRGPKPFEEKRVWKTGVDLWDQAHAEGKSMLVFFGDATDCSRLIHWGILSERPVIEAGSTKYSVKTLRVIADQAPQDLRLRSTGKKIARGFIRPYAIIKTPAFIF